MLSRFISKSSHLRLLTLISPKTHFINPKPISPKPYLFPHFFSTRNNNNNNNSNGRNSDPDFWKLSSETEQSVFNEDDSQSVEGIEKDDVSWANGEEESGDVFKEASEEKGGVGGGEEFWATAEGYKPWSFDVEGKGEQVFDIGEDVKVINEMKGFEEEAKVQSPEEKKLLELEEQVLTGVLKGQVGAIQLGISRALQNWDPELRPPLREGGYLTRDSRVVERKKPGKAKARKSFQWVKR